MKENMCETFVMEVYRQLSKQLKNLDAATCYLPAKYTREFVSIHNVCTGMFCPSMFNKQDVETVLADIDIDDLSVMRGTKFSFLVQFCWKEPQMLNGFFKVRPSYPIFDADALFKIGNIPMVCTDCTFNNPYQTAEILLQIMRTI